MPLPLKSNPGKFWESNEIIDQKDTSLACSDDEGVKAIEYQGQEIGNKENKKKLLGWIQVFHSFLILSNGNGVHNGLSRPMYECHEYDINEMKRGRATMGHR